MSRPQDPQWQVALHAAIKANRSDAHSRYLQLASVDAAGWPRNRTVVFRGFGGDGETLMAVTDSRSAKLVEFQAQPRGEICWYFARTREQFRIAVQVSVVTEQNDADGLRCSLWNNLSDAARSQFYWPTPGVPHSDDEPSPPEAPERVAHYFSVLEFRPQRIDHLKLGHRHYRVISERHQTGWKSWDVNP